MRYFKNFQILAFSFSFHNNFIFFKSIIPINALISSQVSLRNIPSLVSGYIPLERFRITSARVPRLPTTKKKL